MKTIVRKVTYQGEENRILGTLMRSLLPGTHRMGNGLTIIIEEVVGGECEGLSTRSELRTNQQNFEVIDAS